MNIQVRHVSKFRKRNRCTYYAVVREIFDGAFILGREDVDYFSSAWAADQKVELLKAFETI